MKTSNANAMRESLIKALFEQFTANGEDCGMIAAGTFNMPVVAPDGEQGWIEVVVKVPRYDDNEGYALRDEYQMKQTEKAEKAEERKAKAERKKAEREEKEKEKA